MPSTAQVPVEDNEMSGAVMASKWAHPSNDGSMSVAYQLLDEPDRNAKLSDLLNTMCHVFRDHADGNWASVYKDEYARLLAAEIAAFPFLAGRLLRTGDRVIKMVTYRAIELRRVGGSGEVRDDNPQDP